MATSIHLKNSSSSNYPFLELQNNDSNSNSGEIRFIKKKSAVNNDQLGLIKFEGYDDTTTLTEYAQIKVTSSNVSNNSEDGKLIFSTMQSDTDSNTSSLMELMSIKPREFTFGPGPGISSSKVEFNILAPGNTCDAYLYLGTQFGADTSYAKKTAIVAEGQDTDGKAKLHFCLNNDAGNGNVSTSANYTDDSIMTLIPSGNVGIGTTSPSTLLHIYKDDDTDNNLVEMLRLERHCDDLGANANAEGGYISLHVDDDNASLGEIARISWRSDNNDNGEDSGRLGFWTTKEHTLSEKLTITRDGYVGIGTTSPTRVLEVNGTILAKTSLLIGDSTDDGSTRLISALDSDMTGSRLISFGRSNNAGNQAELEFYWVGDNNNSNRIGLGFHSSKPIHILKSGYVGINNSSPTSILDVKGGVNNDYVFSCRSINENGSGNNLGGFFGLKWHTSNNNSANFNLDVYMKDNDSPNNYHQIGRFENDDLDTGAFFTGQHRNIMNTSINETHVGLIVSSSGNILNSNNSLQPSINESLPICILSSIDNDKRVFGVISDKEDSNDSRYTGSGSYKSIQLKTNSNEQRLYINSLGEGAIWVCNKNGSLENGDYISSSSVNGYGMKQILEPNILTNYTVSKITCDCDFSLTKIVKQKLKTVTTTETKQRNVYQDVTESVEKNVINYDETLGRYVKTTIIEDNTTKVKVLDSHDLYDDQGNIIGTHQTEQMEYYDEIIQEIDYDVNGDVQYEDDLDEQGNQQMIYPLETRFLDASGNKLVDEADYTTRLGNGESVYIACFVGCTYHCG